MHLKASTRPLPTLLTRHSPARLTLLSLLAIAAFASLLPPTSAQQAPVFKSRTDVVQLDISVLDQHRHPVKGLTEKNFTIFEDGKLQTIVGFTAFDVDNARPPDRGWMKDVPPDVTTNDLKPESRLWVIVMDDAMIPQDPAMIRDAKNAALKIIQRLGPDDLTAVVFTGDNRKTQDFTNDKAKLRAALDNFNPGLSSYRFGVDTQALDTDSQFFLSSVRTLSEVGNYLSAIPSRRKAVFWISPGVPFDLEEMKPRAALRGSDPTLSPSMGNQVYTADLLDRTQEVFRRAQVANVTIYPVDPTGLDGMRQFIRLRLQSAGAATGLVVGASPDSFFWEQALVTFTARKTNALQDFLTMTAANTGGRTVMNTNDVEPGIAGIFEENTSYYLIAFEPANPAADGRLHKLQVKVDRPDVEVRTRSGYYAPEAQTKEDKRIARAGMTPEAAALAKSLAGILPTAGMPLRVAVAPFAVPGQRLSTVTIVLGVTQPIPASAANGRVTESTDLLTSAFTPEGDPRGAQRHTAKVTLRAGSDGLASYEVLARIDLPTGRYQLRLAAHNSIAAKDGSVFVDVNVPDYSTLPVSATPLILSATPGRVAAPKDLFAPLLPLAPTAERVFAKIDKVTAFMRIYQSGRNPVQPVILKTTVRDAEDRVDAQEANQIGVDQFRSAQQELAESTGVMIPLKPSVGPTPIAPTPAPTADRFANLALRTADVKYALPLGKLAAGPHLLTVEATIGATTIRRDVRFEIK
jgi:VWFA-related protein